jgi:hypothetical protein
METPRVKNINRPKKTLKVAIVTTIEMMPNSRSGRR